LELSSASRPSWPPPQSDQRCRPRLDDGPRLLVYIFERRNFHPFEKSKPLCTCLRNASTTNTRFACAWRIPRTAVLITATAERRASSVASLPFVFAVGRTGNLVAKPLRGGSLEEGFTPLTRSSSFHRSCRTEPRLGPKEELTLLGRQIDHRTEARTAWLHQYDLCKEPLRGGLHPSPPIPPTGFHFPCQYLITSGSCLLEKSTSSGAPREGTADEAHPFLPSFRFS
jgi:hypothetical protein